MGTPALRFVKAQHRRDEHLEQKSVDEQRALHHLRKEARIAKATLASGGKGGLPTSMVLGVMRRDGFRCKVCGGAKGLGIHHKGGDVRSDWLSKKGHKLVLNNLVTICDKSPDGKSCHDRVHDHAREDGTDSSQLTPEGDK